MGLGNPAINSSDNLLDDDDAIPPEAGTKGVPSARPAKGSIMSLTSNPPFGYKFLLNPEAFPDKKSAEYAETKIPGISHPILSWSHGGSRELDLDLLITKDLPQPPLPPGILDKIGSKLLGTAVSLLSPGLPFQPNAKDPGASVTNAPKMVPILGDLIGSSPADPNVFGNTYSIINEVISLRCFLYPSPTVNTSIGVTAPYLINFNYGRFYRDFCCVMTKCDIEWKAWDGDLTPIRAVVKVTLKEFIFKSVSRRNILSMFPMVDFTPGAATPASALSSLGSVALGAAVVGGAVLANGGLGNPIGGLSQQFGKK